MREKFKVGDKVRIKRLNKRTPLWIREVVRLDTKRTVAGVFYDHNTQHTRYYLGSNRKGEDIISNHSFRANELILYQKGEVGHPRVKRGYKPNLVGVSSRG